MFTTYLYSQYELDDPIFNGWSFDTVPPTFDAIWCETNKVPTIQAVCADLKGTLTVSMPLWVQRAARGTQIFIDVTPKLGPLTPYEVPTYPAGGPLTLYLARGAVGDLRSGDRVEITWWDQAGKAHIGECDVMIVRGPEGGFPAGIWESPTVFDHLVHHKPRSPLIGYFPPLSDSDQRRLARTLHYRPQQRHMNAGWMRWKPSPYVVMEALVPPGFESSLEEAQWSVGVMARIAYDGPRTAVWIGRAVNHAPFPGSLNAWFLHGAMSPAPPPKWTLHLAPPFGINVQEPSLFTTTHPVSTELWDGAKPWVRHWPGIILQSPSVYETFQRWMTQIITQGQTQPQFPPLCWGQPDPQPIVEGIQKGYRLIVAFRQWHDLDHLQTLVDETQHLIQPQQGQILDIMGWTRNSQQWL
ncbi:MAG: hypothetical protein C7B43_21330 [Sulfobacillus benefaciens]|uniref:Uncharacterized protein n=1 Tax=Sulfobacillus benefaciens TaxID=453960 RepID=A0A2T2WGJ4_9FIRM|nr:MAG: hypothetical protein C7B43_21330 [Sulfobacillus benefaciens]